MDFSSSTDDRLEVLSLIPPVGPFLVVLFDLYPTMLFLPLFVLNLLFFFFEWWYAPRFRGSSSRRTAATLFVHKRSEPVERIKIQVE